jgi:hypothetical protein
MGRLLLILLSVLVWREDASGASYYISPTGSDTTPGTCTLANPCASFPRCVSLMVAGDTCYARGGTYIVPPDHNLPGDKRGWKLYPCLGGSAGSPMTLRSYPGELAIIKPTSYHNNDQEGTITVTDARCDYLTVTNLEIWGRFVLRENAYTAADNVIIEKNIFRCPGACGTGNTCNVMGENQCSWPDGGCIGRDNLIVRNNYFTIDSSCPDYDDFCNGQEVDFIHLYGNNAPIVENNDFIVADQTKVAETPQVGLRYAAWTKGRAQYAELRYNYCEGPMGSCMAVNTGACPNRPEYDGPPECGLTYPECQCGDATGPESLGHNTIHHNVSYLSGGFGWEGVNYSQYDEVYNNTLVDPIRASGTIKSGEATYRGSDDLSVFNNIYSVNLTVYPTFGTYEGFIFWRGYYGHNYDGICTNTYMDNNMYWGANLSAPDNWHVFSTLEPDNSSATLTAWKSWLAATCPSNPNVRETSSRYLDPLFVNKVAKDFRLQALSPARTGGRGVGYPSYLGAIDPAGGTTIGCTFDPQCYGYVAPATNTRTKVR